MKFLAATLTLTGMASATTPVALASTTALMMDETGNGDPSLFTSPRTLGYTGLTPAEMNAVLSGLLQRGHRGVRIHPRGTQSALRP
jgi:hypothetical protein